MGQTILAADAQSSRRWVAALRRGVVSTAGVLAVALAPSVVLAQAGSLTQPNLGSAAGMQSLQGGAPTGGLRSGEFVLTPSIEIDGHHDTNVFNGNALESGNEPESATSLRLIPRLGLTNGMDGDIQFAFDAAGDARIYVTSNDAIGELTAFGGVADLGVTFFRRRALSLTLSDSFRRGLQANNWETSTTLNRLTNSIGAVVSFHPGEIPERRPLEVTLSGAYVVDKFDDFSAGNTGTLRTALTGSWRFLPMTAVLLDTHWDFRSYDTPSKIGATADSQPWRVRLGLAGAFTETLSFRIVGGWGMSLHDTTNDNATYNGFIGNVGLVYRPSNATLLSASYDRDFQDSFYGNYYSYDSGTISLRQAFGAIVSATAWFTFSYAQYGEFTNIPAGVVVTQAVRKDYMLRGGLRAGIDISRLIAINLGYQLRGVVTNFKIQAQGDNRLLDAGAYTANEIFAGVTVRY